MAMAPSPAHPKARAAPVAIFALVMASVALLGLSAACYPGGTFNDRSAPGFDLARNFLCDLMDPTAKNGEPNPVGALLAPAGLMLFVAAFALFWWILPRLFEPGSRLTRPVRWLGLASLLGIAAVPLVPRFLHAPAIFAAGFPGIAAAILAVIALRAAGPSARGLAALGALTLGVALVDAILYAVVVAGRMDTPLALPLLQRVATVLLIAWVVAVARRLWLAPPRTGLMAPRQTTPDATS